MSKNLALAILFSFAILFSWDLLVMRPQRRAAMAEATRHAPTSAQVPSMAGNAPAAIGAPSVPAADALPAPARKKIVEFTVGGNRLAFNLFGAAVDQWSVREREDRWVPLLPPTSYDERPLTTFPEVEFRVDRRSASGGPGEVFVFTGNRPDGLAIEKTFTIAAEGRLHELTLRLTNTTDLPLAADHALGWGPTLESGDANAKEGASSRRVLALDGMRLLKLKTGTHEGTYRWWGVDSRYFLAAFLNDSGQNVHIAVTKNNGFIEAKMTSSGALAPRAAAAETLRFYAGPKGFAPLAALGLGLERAVDFGTFGDVGKLVLRCLYFLHRVTHNYGWSIILLTLGIQVVVFPLTLKSFRHGQRMKLLQPQMKRLQELHKGDPKRLNAEMLQLYQRHGLKFMGMEGCFPVLIQLPVFWALYTTLRNAYELRDAPWLGWIHDLSTHDPLYVLPLIMGGGMFLQQKMTMASMDPAQARMMYFMPVIFTFMFLKMPAGLVLYWCTNTLVSISVQTVLMKRHQPQGVPS